MAKLNTACSRQVPKYTLCFIAHLTCHTCVLSNYSSLITLKTEENSDVLVAGNKSHRSKPGMQGRLEAREGSCDTFRCIITYA